MRKLVAVLGPCLLALLAVSWISPSAARADHPLAGKWLVKGVDGGGMLVLWLVELTEKNKDLTGAVLDSGIAGLKNAKITKVEAGKKELHIRFVSNGRPLQLDAYALKGGKDTAAFFGSLAAGRNRLPVKIFATKSKEIKTPTEKGPAAADFADVMKNRTVGTRVAALKKFLKKHNDNPGVLSPILQLFRFAGNTLDADTVVAHATRAAELAEKYGPEMRENVLTIVISPLLRSKKGSKLALTYARQLKKALPKKAPLQQRYQTLKLLARALVKNQLAEQAKELQAQLAKIDKNLDAEFIKKNIPFKVSKFKGRKAEHARVVVLELFTGSECPPCVSADIAFDALLKTYNSKHIVALQYHLHIPGPDPLTNNDSEARAKFYKVRGTPSVFINGKQIARVGGYRQHAKDRYDMLVKEINEPLESKEKAEIQVKANRKGPEVNLTAEVAKLPMAGKDMRLHFAVIEDMVRFAGGNGQRLHHHVVRALPGGSGGIELAKKNGAYKASFSLQTIRKNLTKYLDDFSKKRPFRNTDRPLNLDHLYVVAFVQNHETREILNAVQVAVPRK